MAKGEKRQRIEAVYSNIGLGNADPERIAEIVEQYEKAMSTADFVRGNKHKKTFQQVLSSKEKGEEKK